MSNRRTTELLLLLAATPVVMLAFFTFYGNTSNIDNPFVLESLIVPAGLLVAFLIAHISIRFLAPTADPGLLPITYLLCGIGLVFVTRLDPDAAQRQVLWLFLSVIGLILVLAIVRSLDKLARYKYTLMLLALVLLLLPIFVGSEEGGARLWINLGFVAFQPGEFAKILIVLFLGAYLADNREMLSVSTHRFLGLDIPSPKTMFPLLLMWALSLLVVVFEKDLGFALLLFGIFLIMIYAATGRALYVVAGLLLFGLGGTAAYFLFSHVQLRIDIWLDPFTYAADKSYQLVQSLYALADGGFTGVGIGNGLPKRIPAVSTDFIFSAIGEELGFLTAAGVILLFFLFAVRGFATAARAKSDISAFTAVGLTSAVSFQAFVIIGGVTRLIPLTGVTLPFMSRGGTSLFASFIILALLLRAGDEGTGVETEMRMSAFDSGTLGRVALGKRLTHLTVIFAILFALLFANLTYIQVVKADEYQARTDNTRNLVKSAKQERGAIMTSDGVTLAESIKGTDGLYKRKYPKGEFAVHTVGYIHDKYGMSGIEAEKNDILTGKVVYATWSDVINAALGKSVAGNNVVLTIDSKVQEAAERALAGSKGSVVVLDPKSGAVLASASNPTFNPNDLESIFGKNADEEKNNEDGVLMDRARDVLYPPGSTFKVVTLAGALDKEITTAKTIFSAPSPLKIGNAPVTNYNGASSSAISVRDAFVHSYNTVFAQLAVDLGPEEMVKTAKKFGFESRLGLDLKARPSLMPDPKEMTTWETAWAGAGQPVGEHDSPAGPQATVTQMALVGSAIANGGVIYEPYTVAQITSPSGEVLSKTRRTKLGTATSSAVAKELQGMMEEVVTRGSGAPARNSEVSIAGKTGTAEVGENKPSHTWFIGFAPADKPTAVISIIIENGDGGPPASSKVAPILKQAVDSVK